MAKYLLDTTTIIDHLHGDKKVNAYLEEIGNRGDCYTVIFSVDL